MDSIRPPSNVTDQVFSAWRLARRGQGQAEKMTNPLWTWLVAEGHGPFAIEVPFDDPPAHRVGPRWTNDRFGQSTTELPDGRQVLIGGEHEDYYDPDFFLYNDVIIVSPDGGIEILGYGEDIFPPTDFHTATLVEDEIVLVGNVGYTDRRQAGVTPVLVFDTTTWNVGRPATAGDAPGWLSDHTALHRDDQKLVVSGGKVWTGEGRGYFLENPDEWELDLSTWRWRRLTARGWQQWQIGRADGGPSRLWEFRTARLSGSATDADDSQLDALYVPPVEHRSERMDRPEEFNISRLQVEGVTVRYVEDMGGVRVVIEGELPEPLTHSLVDDLVAKLSELDGNPYTAARLA